MIRDSRNLTQVPDDFYGQFNHRMSLMVLVSKNIYSCLDLNNFTKITKMKQFWCNFVTIFYQKCMNIECTTTRGVETVRPKCKKMIILDLKWTFVDTIFKNLRNHLWKMHQTLWHSIWRRRSPRSFIFIKRFYQNDHSWPSQWSKWSKPRNSNGIIGFNGQNIVRKNTSKICHNAFNFYVSHANQKVGAERNSTERLLVIP